MIKRLLVGFPYLYFMLVWCWMGLAQAISGKPGFGYLLNMVICLACLYQLFVEKKPLNILLGILMLLWSIWIFFAYLWDVFNPHTHDIETWRGYLGGGLLVAMNLLMSVLLIRKAFDNRVRNIITTPAN